MNVFIPVWVLYIPVALLIILVSSAIAYVTFHGVILAIEKYCDVRGILQLFLKYLRENPDLAYKSRRGKI